MTTVWTEQRKKEWFETHPCLKKDGKPGRPHKEGRCKNCGGCIRCGKPPWCEEHIRGRKRTISPTNFQSPARRGRGQAATITPSPVPNRTTLKDDYPSPTRKTLEEYDRAQEKEKERANSLANRFNDLDTIEALPSTKLKIAKLKNVFQQIINQVGKDEKQRAKMSREIAEGLEPTFKQATKLNSNLATLIINGGTASKRVGKALLLSSCSEKDARKILLDNGWSERRKQIVEINKTERDAETDQDEVCQFVSPLADRKNNAVHRRNFQVYLSRGEDIPPRLDRTKISQQTMVEAVAVILANAHYRPGKLRNVWVRNEYLKNLPLFHRYCTVNQLYATYRETPKHAKAMGYNSFRTVVKALTRKGSYQQGSSYFHTDFLDMMALLEEAQERMNVIAQPYEGDTASPRSFCK